MQLIRIPYRAFVVWLVAIIAVLSGCRQTAEKQELAAEQISITADVLPDTAEALHMTGKALAQAYCQACHLFPDPALLDKATWQRKVVPQMALRLGLGSNSFGPYLGKSTEEIDALLQANIFPQKPYVSEANWQKIVAYYTENAPDNLRLPAPAAIRQVLTGFSINTPALNKGKTALTTMVKYLPEANELWVGDLRNQMIKLSQKLVVVDSVQLDTPPVALLKSPQHYHILTIGSIIPSDKGSGRLYQLPHTGAAAGVAAPVLEGLQRPVSMVQADLNQDNISDLVVCNFGFNLGALVWYQGLGKGKYKQHVLKNLPGALKAEVLDLNKDGLPDIVALFAQGTEAIRVFYNLGNGNFREENLLQLPPVYGVSYFELADFNNDGAPDILLANGDNADYSPILKPYHGIRIYLDDGDNNFSEKYFFPMSGATKAIARDFDKDGDLDIAAIAYFSDFETAPEKGFLYLEQTGKLTFTAATFAQSQVGRWFTMDTGDYDGDGDEDIFLGSFTNALTPAPAALQKKWWQQGPSLVVLQNTAADQAPEVVSAKQQE